MPTIVDEFTVTNGRSLLKTETVMEVVDVRPALVTYTVNTDVVPTTKEDDATMTKFCERLPEGR